jgi:hypothetical protein
LCYPLFLQFLNTLYILIHCLTACMKYASLKFYHLESTELNYALTGTFGVFQHFKHTKYHSSLSLMMQHV